MVLRRLQLGVAVALVLQIGEGARAHDMEHLAQAALHPRDPNVMVLRFVLGGDGLFYTQDGGASWQLLCKSAIYPDAAQIYDTVIAGDGHVLLATATGVYEDDGHGCGWSSVPALAERWVLDFAPHPTDPNVLFAAASDAAQSAYGLVRRDGSGEWTDLGSDPGRIVQRVLAAQTPDGLRLYTSAYVDTVAVDGIDMQNFVIRVSDDEGASWREHPYGPVQGGFRLEAVDPSNPDRLVAVIHRLETRGHTLDEDLDQVLVSSDQGATFAHYLVVTESSNVTLAPDGRVWIGDLGSTMHTKASQGLWFAPDLATAPERLAEYPVACLAHQPTSDTLLMCQRWWFGTVDRGSGEFSASMRFHEVEDLVQCAGTDLTASCQVQLCRSYCLAEHFAQAPACRAYDEQACRGGAVVQPPPADAGPVTPTDGGDAGEASDASGSASASASPDAAADAATAARDDEASGDDGCGCMLAGAPRSSGTGAGALAGAALAILVRRTRSSQTRAS